MFKILYTNWFQVYISRVGLSPELQIHITNCLLDNFSRKANRLIKCNCSKPNSCSSTVFRTCVNDISSLPVTQRKNLGLLLSRYHPALQKILSTFLLKYNQIRSLYTTFATSRLQVTIISWPNYWRRLTGLLKEEPERVTIKKLSQLSLQRLLNLKSKVLTKPFPPPL